MKNCNNNFVWFVYSFNNTELIFIHLVSMLHFCSPGVNVTFFLPNLENFIFTHHLLFFESQGPDPIQVSPGSLQVLDHKPWLSCLMPQSSLAIPKHFSFPVHHLIKCQNFNWLI